MRALALVSGCVRHAVPAAFALMLALAIPLNFWPHTRTQAFVAAPPIDLVGLREGRWMKAAEKAAQESSSLAVRWRSLYAEAAYRLGVLDNPDVAFGREQWLFLRESLQLDAARFAARSGERARFFVELRRYVERLGVTLVVAIAPDKERLYPEFIYPERRMSPGREAIYATAVAELRAAGLAAVDLATPLLARRRGSPDAMLYYPRDTHWALDGAAVAAAAVKRHGLDLGWLALAGEPVPYHPTPVIERSVVGDLVPMLGFAADGDLAGLPRMAGRAFGLWLHGKVLEVAQPQARLALCGTSFSDVHFGLALCAATGVAIDRTGVRVGGGPFAGLFSTLTAVARGELAARVVVWEFVERQLMTDWQALLQMLR